MTLMLRQVRSACVLAVALLAGGVGPVGTARAQEIVVAPTRPTGVYDVGEPVEWRVEYKGPAAPPELAYVLKKHNLTVAREGAIPLADGVGTLRASLDEPGTLLVEFRAPAAAAAAANNGGAKPAAGGKPVRGLGGAAVAPSKIEPSAPPPADFDAFWAAKLAELAAVPANPQVEPADAGQPAGGNRPPVDYFKVRLDNVRGSHVYGQLARPKADGKHPTGKFPALLVVQYAGVYGLPKANVVGRAERGWLCLNVMAHDLPFDRPEAFYKEQAAGPLKDYVRIGNEDRDTSYFLRMYLGCHRAADYLASRDDWDGRTLVVMGTSQGGMQSILTAAVHPRVTAMLANVPGGCDNTGSQIGRANGWPNWAGQAWGRDPKKVVEASRYYDLVNFAPRVTCPSLVSVGLIDETCTPPGIFAACNRMTGPVETIVLPRSDHQGHGGTQAAYFRRSEDWLRALAKGEPIPDVRK